MGAAASAAKSVLKTAGKLLDVVMSLLGIVKDLVVGIGRVFNIIQGPGGIVQGLATVLRIFIGFVISCWVLIFGPLLKQIFTLIFRYIGPAVTVSFYTLILVIMVPVKLALALIDCLLKGRLRFLEFEHESPDAWWQRAGYERGNRYSRFVVSWLPCAKGYLPSSSGITCACEPSNLPRHSPASLLVRHYLWGSFRDWGRRLPARDADSLKRFRSLCSREYAEPFRGHDGGKYARDLVECLILARGDIFAKVSDAEEIATYASWATAASGGRMPPLTGDRTVDAVDDLERRFFLDAPILPMAMIACSSMVVVTMLMKHRRDAPLRRM